MSKFGCGALVAVLLARAACAGDLSVVGHDLSWRPASGPSPAMLLKVYRDVDPVELWGWQLILDIVPDANATGSVLFRSAVEPPNYILAGALMDIEPSSFDPSATVGPITHSTFPGRAVPVWPGANLLQLDFAASPDAAGRFDVAVAPDVFVGSRWFSSDFVARDFLNVPPQGGPVVVGSISVGAAVPEPSGGIVFWMTAAAFSLCRGRRRLRARSRRDPSA